MVSKKNKRRKSIKIWKGGAQNENTNNKHIKSIEHIIYLHDADIARLGIEKYIYAASHHDFNMYHKFYMGHVLVSTRNSNIYIQELWKRALLKCIY